MPSAPISQTTGATPSHDGTGIGCTSDADIDAPEAWKIETGEAAEPVIVAVIDSGAAPNITSNPTFAATVGRQYEYNAMAIDSDGELASKEDYLMRKICNLLRLEPGYLAEARKKVADGDMEDAGGRSRG